MGLRGPTPGPPERRVGHRSHAVTRLDDHRPVVQAPTPPAGLLKATQQAWEAYWASPVSNVADRRSDMPAITRLFQLYDERERCYRASRKGGRLVAGSQGQPVLNPLYKHLGALDDGIRALEDRLGLTPASRARLGLSIAHAADACAALTDVGDDSDDDPRLDAS